MDNILSLFEIVTSPNNHAVVFKDYLQICTENQVFINKTPKELKPVVTFINNKLNATSNRIEGLHVLQTFLPQCSKDIFRENALMWLQQCLKSIDGTSISITILAYKLIKTLLEMTQQLPEMRRTVSSIVVSKLIENLQHNIQSECLLAILQCIETLMFNYGPTCGHNKNVLEKILLQYIDSPDNNVVIRVARCMAHMPLLSNAGPLGANHTSRWIQEQQRLCATLHGILDELFVAIEENENMFNIAIPSSKLPLPEISIISTTLTQVTNLVRRFVNVTEILRGLFLVKFTAEKTVQIELVLQLIYRGLNVTDKSFSNTTAAEVQMIRALLPRIQVKLLRVLSSVINCLGRNLIPHGLAIVRIIYHTLSWTATECPYGVEKPYREVRATACDTFALWLQTAMTGSCVERVADKFAENLLPDINPGKTAVTLIDITPKKGSSKQLKKSAIAERSKQAATIAPDLELYIIHQKANRRVCRAALKVMQWMFVSSSMFLNTFIHEKLQNITVKLLVDIQRSGQQHLVPIPYSDGQCREELYNLLLMIIMNPHPLRPVPVDQALAIFANGCKDAHIETAATCKIGLNILEKLISGVRPSQHFPLTVEEMLDSMNVEQENMEQDIEDEVEQIEDEVVEEEEEDDVEEEEEEEDDEEEEEEEEEEVEDEMPKIKIGEAITLAPNKATPKQMVVEEERSAKKIENKTFQQPVEKPEANKKDEDDVVEVLTEDEMPWDVRKVRKEKMTSEADEMLEDEEEYGSEEDEEGMEIGEDEELEDEYEDEEDIAEVESEGEEMEHTFIAHSKVIKSMPVEVEKKDVTKSESKYNIQRTLVTHQENVNEVALSSTEHMHSQDKVSLPSANGIQEKAKELDSSIEEVQEEIVEPSSEVLQSSAEESQEQNEVVVHTATEEIQMVASPAEQEHITEKISINSQNEIENNTVVEEVSEVQDLEDHIAVSVVESKRMRREYEDIDDRDEVHDEDNDDGMHEECDEQMEEENAYESRNGVPVEHQEENQNELHYSSDKMTTESDKDITEEPVDEALVNENVCEAAGNELIQNDDATFESEVVQKEDNTTLKPEVSDEMEKQEALEEGSDSKKEDTCEEEVASEQYSDIPKPEGYVLNEENCIDKENTVVDSGDSEVNMATISETNLEADNVQMDDKEIPETEINAATKKVPHTSEHEEPEEPSRKKMKMDISATLADGPKTVDTEISNADVKVNNTSDSNKTEVVLNGITKTADEITDEEFIAAFVPDVSPDELK